MLMIDLRTARKGYMAILRKLGFPVNRTLSPTNEELLLQPTCLFDQPFYEQQCGRFFEQKLDAIRHYLGTGSNCNYDPNPLFDNHYYLSKNPDVAESCMNPLIHFVCFGAQERRNPHNCFHQSIVRQNQQFNIDFNQSHLFHSKAD